MVGSGRGWAPPIVPTPRSSRRTHSRRRSYCRQSRESCPTPPGLGREIVALWVAIAATLVSFGRVSPAAAGLLVPYLLWVTYATALNGTIWVMNS
ncbi:MAG TPA: TspO/MBR family protein [Fimbriiglobus sp.]|nr:TspO/MBR family protein [Fimbriiglobus sp.]